MLALWAPCYIVICLHSFCQTINCEERAKKKLWKNFDHHLSKTPTTSSQTLKIIQVPKKKKKKKKKTI
jgi:hypothetical protein